MVKRWIAILTVAALLVCHGYSKEPPCPNECVCKDHPVQNSVMMRCKTLTLKNKPSVPIAHFEIIQSEQPILMAEHVFTSIGLSKVSSITISNSSVVSIEKDAFRELTELRDLKITHTNISAIHPDTFAHNKKLVKLNLANNPLNKIENFVNSASVEELDMSNCNLTKISVNMFRNLSNLQSLDLRGNNIKELIDGTFDNLIDITEIHLENNQISHLSEHIFEQNIDLENLYLDNNPIVEFSGKTFSNLDTLSLRSCKIETLEDGIFNSMEDLSNLDLSNNKITTVTRKALYDLKNLITINLSGNDIRQIDEHIFYNNKNLRKIDLDDNRRMSRLPANGFKIKDGLSTFNVYWFSCRNCGINSLSEKTFDTMLELSTLLLSNNKIYDVRTKVFQPLKNLNELDLSYNQISTMDEDTFRNNVNLFTLNLAGNPIKSLHPSIFKHTTNLHTLNLHDCGLSSLWTGTKKERLPSIQNLNVSSNRINLITKEDVEVTNGLKSIDFSGNKLNCTDSYKNLVEYLTEKEIQDTEYVTHENMAYTIEEGKIDDMGVWKKQAQIKCPNLSFETKDIDDNNAQEDIDEDDEEEEDEDDEEYDDDDYDQSESGDTTAKYNSDVINSSDVDAMFSIPRHESKISYLWLVLVFLGAALATLGIVANAILFVIRRKQTIEVPRINIRPMSKLKKNSGLVYQQLSEERDGVKTPVLGRFIPMPTVHTPNAPEHV